METRTLASSAPASGEPRRCWSGGHSLIELLLVLALLGICLLMGSVCILRGLNVQESRGVAQAWQAAAASAQVEALWKGSKVRLSYVPGELALSPGSSEYGSDAGYSTPPVPVTANVSRWRDGTSVTVGFGGFLSSPDGGGSLFFGSGTGDYRVVVRPESGLTVRSRSGSGQ